MTTTIRTNEPRELLALIPYQLGFRPRESVVAVSLRGGTRVGLVARVDLADLAHPGHGPRVARSLVGHLLDDGATAMVVVLYTNADLDAAGNQAIARLADAGEPYLPEPECWVVGRDGYYAPACRDPQCCPPGGRPLADLEATRIGAEMVLLGAPVVDDRADLARLPRPDEAARRSARRAAKRWTDRARRTGGADALARWRREGLEVWRGLVEGADPVPPTLGRCQAALDDLLVRDAVLLDLIPGRAGLADRVVAGWDGSEISAALRELVDPNEGVAPPDRVAAAATVLAAVAGHRPRAAVPAVTLLAMTAWWQGDGARAGVLVERALASDPGYRLAVLLEQTLAAGMPPGWLREPPG
ncbi:DUF4192 domain-containing protein [Isoptericola sp. b490]|uniref:DUF4192 domain-containing protein n=1 Tax=Actinotalea lenta TaxID=3064654 RepID=UPI002713D23B|nr:DUF4192 domain-containing protein [Isoptericola sp. b490]MDO8120395.1 DUF4192 domain-containing protein [Isoptericola sp. b490]